MHNAFFTFQKHFSKYLFIYLAASGLSYSTWNLCCVMQDLLLWCLESLVVAQGLWNAWTSEIVSRRLSCSMAGGILVSQWGIEPESPSSQGGFLTTGPPGKFLKNILSLDNIQTSFDDSISMYWSFSLSSAQGWIPYRTDHTTCQLLRLSPFKEIII